MAFNVNYSINDGEFTGTATDIFQLRSALYQKRNNMIKCTLSGYIDGDLRTNTTGTSTGAYGLFYNFNNLITIDLTDLDTSGVTNMDYLFSRCSKLRNIYVSDKWNTANVTAGTNGIKGYHMFEACPLLPHFNNEYCDLPKAYVGNLGYLKNPEYEIQLKHNNINSFVKVKTDGNTIVENSRGELTAKKPKVNLLSQAFVHYSNDFVGISSVSNWRFIGNDSYYNYPIYCADVILTNGESLYLCAEGNRANEAYKVFDKNYGSGSSFIEASYNNPLRLRMYFTRNIDNPAKIKKLQFKSVEYTLYYRVQSNDTIPQMMIFAGLYYDLHYISTSTSYSSNATSEETTVFYLGSEADQFLNSNGDPCSIFLEELIPVFQLIDYKDYGHQIPNHNDLSYFYDNEVIRCFHSDDGLDINDIRNNELYDQSIPFKLATDSTYLITYNGERKLYSNFDFDITQDLSFLSMSMDEYNSLKQNDRLSNDIVYLITS